MAVGSSPSRPKNGIGSNSFALGREAHIRASLERPPLGSVGTRKEGEDPLVHPTERRLRGNVAASFEEFGHAEARLHGQALVVETESGERLAVERRDLGLSLGRLVDGFRRRVPPPRKADTPRECRRPPRPRPSSATSIADVTRSGARSPPDALGYTPYARSSTPSSSTS